MSFVDDPTVDMKKVHAMRKLGASPVPTSVSKTDVPLAKDARAKEFRSCQDLHKWRKKHVRTNFTNLEKFSGDMLQSSFAVGWALDDPTVKKEYRRPENGITDSVVTRVYNNMKMTNMEAILRYGN